MAPVQETQRRTVAAFWGATGGDAPTSALRRFLARRFALELVLESFDRDRAQSAKRLRNEGDRPIDGNLAHVLQAVQRRGRALFISRGPGPGPRAPTGKPAGCHHSHSTPPPAC